jgi:hypothetical protein
LQCLTVLIVPKDDFIGFRVQALLKRALEEAAAADHRSLGQLCTLVLMKFLEDRGEWPAKERAAATGARRNVRSVSRAKARR